MRGYKLQAWKQMRWKSFKFCSLLRKVHVFTDTAWAFAHFQLQADFNLKFRHLFNSKYPCLLMMQTEISVTLLQQQVLQSVEIGTNKVMKMFWSLDLINWNHEVHLVASKKSIRSCNFHSSYKVFCDKAD